MSFTTSTPDELQNEQELVRHAKRDPEAFGQLYELYYERIYRFFTVRLRHQPLCQDLTAHVFEKALRGLAKFKWQKVPFGAWLFRIASNVLTDHFRKSGRRHVSNLEDVSWLPDLADGPHQQAERRERRTNVRQALDSINHRYRAILTYKFIDQLTNEEIAKLLNEKKENVAVLAHRALRALSHALPKPEEES